VKPKLLIVELWGLGDLAIATPFLCAAAGKFEVTLLAKPFARELQKRLWPDVRVETFTAPWTAFKNKYHLWRWPLLEISRLRQRLALARFDFGLSARWDPRDHLLLKTFGAQNRLGFPRLGSGRLTATNRGVSSPVNWDWRCRRVKKSPRPPPATAERF
jgi:heptosyltransferase-2